MVFYELVCLARANLSLANKQDLLKSAALTVLQDQGVVRGFQNLGGDERPLPYRMRRHQQYHTHSLTWLMHFDANPKTMQILRQKLERDARVIRATIIKLGDKLTDQLLEGEKNNISVN